MSGECTFAKFICKIDFCEEITKIYLKLVVFLGICRTSTVSLFVWVVRYLGNIMHFLCKIVLRKKYSLSLNYLNDSYISVLFTLNDNKIPGKNKVENDTFQMSIF